MRRFALALCFVFVLWFGLSSPSGAQEIYYPPPNQHPEANIPSFVGYVPNEIVVKFDPAMARKLRSAANAVRNSGSPFLDQLNAWYRVARIRRHFRWSKKARRYAGQLVDLSTWYRVRFRGRVDILEAIDEYAQLPSVIEVQPIGLHRIEAFPNDPHYQNGNQWHLDRIQAPEAWDIESGKSNVIIAVADTGVRYYHDDLGGLSAQQDDVFSAEGNIWRNPGENNNGGDDDGNGKVNDAIGWDFVANAGFLCNDGDCSGQDNNPKDFNGHGTHVAGISGAITSNGIHGAGVAGAGDFGTGDGIRLMSLRIGYSAVFYGGLVNMSYAAQALDYAAAIADATGAKIIYNASWGTSNSGGFGSAVDNFLAAGGLLTHAAGNQGQNSPDFLGNHPDDRVINIGATNEDDNKAFFSNFGSWVDVFAPGVGIVSTYSSGYGGADQSASVSGTSMASPMAAGVAALIWSQDPSLTAMEVRDRLVDSADDVADGKRINAFNAVSGEAPPVLPEISIDDVAVTEGHGGSTTAVFTVSLSLSSDQEVTVNFATADGSAAAGSDYVAGSGTVSFPAGTNFQEIEVTVNGDTTDEPDENFFVNLTVPANATIADGQGLGSIHDDDGPPEIAINDVSVAEGDAGQVQAVFTASLSEESGKEITVGFATADGSAMTSDGDYEAQSGTSTFPPGSIFQEISVTVNGDTTDEPNESFLVNLTTPTNATIADGQGLGIIEDDDEPSADALHVGSLNVTRQAFFIWSRAIATVRILDQDGAPIQGANVSGSWSGGATDTDQFVTDFNGQGTAFSNWTVGAPDFTFCVTGVTHGLPYDPGANGVTCASTSGATSSVAAR